MNILITGATGLVGSVLCEELYKKGHHLFVTTRSPKHAWKKIGVPCTPLPWPLDDSCRDHLSQIEAVVNLMGENVAGGRWTEKKKKTLIESRVQSGVDLFNALSKAEAPLSTWVNATAIGLYGAHPDKVYDESSPAGNDFLASLAKQWEDTVYETPYTPNPDLRRVSIRIGVVLSTEGGALNKMLPAFENYVGGPISNGKQWFSWIHIDDLIKIFLTALENKEMVGPYNGVAPNPVTNQQFTRSLSATLKRIAPFPAPAPILKLALGEMSTILIDGHHVIPKKLNELNFEFQFPDIDSALNNLLENYHLGFHKYKTTLWIPKPIEEVFEFFCDAKNLEEITPDILQFKIVGMSTETIEKNTELVYDLKIHGIPKKWKTLIEKWDPPHSFVDTQLEGPYSLWHHTHDFQELHGGTLMVDTVIYKPPLGLFGRIAELLFVRKDIEAIFNYRRQVILERFAK